MVRSHAAVNASETGCEVLALPRLNSEVSWISGETIADRDC
jgi:hypothetical protein